MENILKFKVKRILTCLGAVIFAIAYIAPLQAQKIDRLGHRNQITYKPLERYNSNSRTDNFTTATPKGKSDAVAAKYRHVGTDGYVLNEPSNLEGEAVPLYLYYNDKLKDNFTTTRSIGARVSGHIGYRRVRIEGYILKTVKPEYQHLYKPLRSYYSDRLKNNMTTTRTVGPREVGHTGYQMVMIEGYVSITNRNSAAIDKVLVDDSRNDFLINNPPRSTQEDLQKWNTVVNKMQGIEGFDPVGNHLGLPPAEKTGGGGFATTLESIDNWIPIDHRKHACCGKLKKFKIYDGGGAEMDWGFYIDPNDSFSFLVTDALQHKDPEWANTAWNGEWRPGGWHTNEGTNGYLLEGELTPHKSLYDNVFFPKRGKEEKHFWGDITITPELGIIGKEICLYGPWVRELVHNNRPEIHPSEMIWWREPHGYYMMLIQDDSRRFSQEKDFDLSVGLVPTSWKPWAEPPLTAQFKIAFKVNPSESGLPLKMDVREMYNRFVVTKEDADASADSDNGTSHALVVNNKRLLVVNEQQNNDEDLGVKFVEITERTDGNIQGYVQITTKVGGSVLSIKDPFGSDDIIEGEEGYHIIYVASSNVPN